MGIPVLQARHGLSVLSSVCRRCRICSLVRDSNSRSMRRSCSSRVARSASRGISLWFFHTFGRCAATRQTPRPRVPASSHILYATGEARNPTLLCSRICYKKRRFCVFSILSQNVQNLHILMTLFFLKSSRKEALEKRQRQRAQTLHFVP